MTLSRFHVVAFDDLLDSADSVVSPDDVSSFVPPANGMCPPPFLVDERHAAQRDAARPGLGGHETALVVDLSSRTTTADLAFEPSDYEALDAIYEWRAS